MENGLIISYLLTAGRVIRDQLTGKFTYIDVFDVIIVPKGESSTLTTFVVGGKILNGKAGLLNLEVRIVAEVDNSIVARSTLGGVINDGDIEIAANFPIVKIEKEGKHFIQVWLSGKELPTANQFFFKVELAK